MVVSTRQTATQLNICKYLTPFTKVKAIKEAIAVIN